VWSTKRLSSPKPWEIEQLIASGAIHPSEYPIVNNNIANPTVTAKVEEDVNIEVHKDEPSFLAGQTKCMLHLSPIKVIQAPDGLLNHAALAGAALTKDQQELRQQEQNDWAGTEARDFNAPWLEPMSKDSERMSSQDLRGNLKGQKSKDVPQWKEVTFNKATMYGEISKLSIQDQRKSLPIYKLWDPLLQAIADVWPFCAFYGFSAHACSTASGAGHCW
jgi:ATP-dependent RNA helicase DHX8/PRP22